MKLIKYWFLRNYYVLFRKNRLLNIIFAEDWCRAGNILKSYDEKTILCLGKNVYLKMD